MGEAFVGTLTLVGALFVGWKIGDLIRWLWRRYVAVPAAPVTARPSDEALIVSFLAEFGPSHLSRIQGSMDDFTHGREDWTLRDEGPILACLERLIADGTVRREPVLSWYAYRLVAPASALLPVEPSVR